MRGEDFPSPRLGVGGAGSPPHARGRQRVQPVLAHPGRITPACAGKTVHSADAAPILSDHPRMRGEDSSHAFSASESPGSPPHARGRRPGFERKALMQGITPACAGKTAVQTGSKSRSKDHPRMRGED